MIKFDAADLHILMMLLYCWELTYLANATSHVMESTIARQHLCTFNQPHLLGQLCRQFVFKNLCAANSG